MRVVIQRVKQASVKINKSEYSSISNGLLVFISVENFDTDEDIDWLSKKICNLRIFNDEESKMNLSVLDVKGDVLLVSQFTLHASTKKGNRPSYIRASKPEIAIPLYNKFVKKLTNHLGKEVKTGEFGAMMDIFLINDGPVTIVIDTKNKE